jgi:hypothetical protein
MKEIIQAYAEASSMVSSTLQCGLIGCMILAIVANFTNNNR